MNLRRLHGALVGLAILTMGFSASPIHAQVDPNIQSRIEAVTTLPPPPPSVGQTKTIKEPPRTIFVRLDELTPAQREAYRLQNPKIQLESINPATRVPQQVPGREYTVTTKRTTDLFVTLPFGYAMDTNATKTNVSNYDSSWALGTNLQLSIPRGDLDTISLSSGWTALRYNTFTRLSVEAIASFGNYSWVLRQFDAPIDGGKPATKITDAVDFRLAHLMSLTPGFQKETIQFVTPSVQLSRKDIPLSVVHPFFLDLLGSAAHTWSDIATSENTNVTGSAVINWRPFSNLTLSLTGSASGVFWDNVSGGRNDLVFKAKPGIEWKANDYLILSLNTTVTSQKSTLAPFEWDGTLVAPQLAARVKVPLSN